MSLNVLDPSNYTMTFYALPPLAVGLTILMLGWIVLLRERASVVSLFFCVLTIDAALWLVCYTGVYTARHEAIALFWIKLENAAVVFIPSTVHLFTLVLLGRLSKFRKWVFLNMGLSLFFTLTVMLTPWFIQGTYLYEWGRYAKYGPFSFAFLVFFSVVMLGSLRLYKTEYRHALSPLKKRRLKTIFIAFAIGYLGSVDYLAAYGIPVYPFGYLPAFIFLVLMAQGIWRYRLFDITPSFAAEQIIKTMADGLLVIDSDAVIRVANKTASGIFGSPETELVGRPASVLGLDFFKVDRLARLIWTGKVQNHELQFDHPVRGYTILEISSSVIRDSAGKGIAIVCIAKDITQRKRSEQELRESEKRYRLLAENVTDVIWIMDAGMRFTFISPSVMRLRGFTPEEAMTHNLERSLTPASFQTMISVLAEEIGKKIIVGNEFQSRTVELEYLRKDGATVSTEVRLTFVRDAEGHLVEIVGVTRDISERRKTEQALLETERTYLDFIKDAPYPIITFNRLGYVEFMNPAAELVLGYNTNELAGQHVTKANLLAQESVPKTLQEFTLTILGWQRPSFDVKVIRKSGTTLNMQANPRLIRRDKKNSQIQLILRDIPNRQYEPLSA